MMDWLGIPALWDQVVDFFTISAFWLYLLYVIAISAGLIFLGWVFPPLRTFAGAIVIAMGVGLFGYRRGEKDAEERARAKAAKELQQQARRERPRENWWPFN